MTSKLKETRDETPIDEEWLKSIGFDEYLTKIPYGDWFEHPDDSFPLFLRRFNSHLWTARIGCCDWPVDIFCRFQVIDLLRCLERGPAYDEPCGSGKEGE